MSTPLKKSLYEALILIQAFVIGLSTIRGLAGFQALMIQFPYDTVHIFIYFILVPLFWIVALLTTLTQIRLKTLATARQTFIIEAVKSGIVTVLYVWFVVEYFVGFTAPPHPYGPGVLHKVICVIVYFIFNSLVFYPTLYIGWKGTRTGGIRLSEQAESLLPQ